MRKSIDQSCRETHTPVVDAGRGQSVREAHQNAAAPKLKNGRTNVKMKPIAAVSDQGRGHDQYETQKMNAAPNSNSIDHMTSETHVRAVDAGRGHVMCGAQAKTAAPKLKNGRTTRSMQPSRSLSDQGCGPTVVETHIARAAPTSIDQIKELWRRRQTVHRAEKSLTLQATAVCRRYVGGDKTLAQKLLIEIERGKHHGPAAMACASLLAAREIVEADRLPLEKELAKLASTLPVAPWVESVRGFGLASLYSIIGETGDLFNYATVSRVWKRMGMAVIKGQRQRKVAGVGAKEQGFAPHRRSVVWVIAGNMIRATKPGGKEPYRAYYEKEKAKQFAKGITLKHADNRAKRHMTKKLLCDLWVAWHKGAAKISLKPILAVSRPTHNIDPEGPENHSSSVDAGRGPNPDWSPLRRCRAQI